VQIVATNPTPEQKDVGVDTAIWVRFDRFLDPTTVIRQSVRITGGTIGVDGSTPAGTEFASPFYDVIERVAVYRLGGLQPGVRYTVTIWSPDDNQGTGFRAFDGAPLAATTTFSFTTSTNPTTSANEPTQPVVNFCSQCTNNHVVRGGGQILLQGCAFGTCHGTDTEGGPPNNLDLSTFEAFQRTAIGHVAHQTLSGPTSTPEVLATRFGASMPLIDRNQPGNSYLLYKILIAPTLWPAAGAIPAAGEYPNQPVGGDIKPSDDELARLQESFVMGGTMPLGIDSFKIDQARAIQAWIASGAPAPATTSCASVSKCGKTAAAGAGGASGSGGSGGEAGQGGAGGTGGNGGSGG
jgi:uncharacterized membrane protein YgcG